MSQPLDFILASGSPRRRELLSLAGWTFTVMPADIDETPHPDEPARAYVLRMAAGKAAAVADQVPTGQTIVAADTSVANGAAILGKPRDRAEAEAMLRGLRGHTHQVYTGIAVLQAGNSEALTDVCTTNVPMRNYSDPEMQAYIDSGDPFDKAGGYAIQHAEFHPAHHLTECYANVMGLPLCHLKRLLDRTSAATPSTVPERCQQALAYNCSIYSTILP